MREIKSKSPEGNVAVEPHFAEMYIQEASIEGGDGPDPDSKGGPGMFVRNGANVLINGHRAGGLWIGGT